MSTNAKSFGAGSKKGIPASTMGGNTAKTKGNKATLLAVRKR